MGKIKNKNNKNEGRKRNPIGTSVVILIPMLLLLFGSGHASGAVVQEPNRLILEKAFKIQMPFIENQGQISDDHVRFYAQTFGGALKVTESGEIIHSFLLTELQNHTKDRHSPRPSSNRVVKSWTLKEKLVGNLNPVLQGMDESKAKANYFIGNDQKKHKTDIPTYNVVSLGEVYKGIELILKAHGKNVEKIFTMKPGADPRAIKLAIEGANSLNINDKGELEVGGDLSVVKFAKPLAYQEINGKRVEVNVAYDLQAFGLRIPDSEVVYNFKVGGYDTSTPLIIDPTLVYSTYRGASKDDMGNAIAVDSSGNAYIAGASQLQYGDYPYHYYYNVVIIKIDPLGNLISGNFIGGSDGDSYGTGIAVDSSGNVYLAGYTYAMDFYTVNPIQPNYGSYPYSFSNGDAFVTKIDSTNNIVYSTYLGGMSFDQATGIAADSFGNAYITGQTVMTIAPYYPTTPGAFDTTTRVNDVQAFVTKIDPTGSSLVYSTYLGGTLQSTDTGNAIAVDSNGYAYVAGSTESTDFPIKNAFQPTLNGGNPGFDGFVTKINTDGTGLVYSTYLGGSCTNEGAFGIAVDSSGNAYVTGVTFCGDFPTLNPIQNHLYSLSSPYVTKINPNGGLVYSTYLSVAGAGEAIAVDNSGNAYITGQTEGLSTVNPVQGTFGGGPPGDAVDAFVTMIDASGQFIVYQTYLGGSGFDTGYGIAVDGSKNAYVTGETYSTDFPTVSPLQPNNAGGSDAFVSKISAARISCSYSISPTSASYSAGEWNSSVSVSALTPSPWCGWSATSNNPDWITITGGASGSGDGTVTYSVAANPGPGTRTGTLTIAGQTFTVNQAAPVLTYTLNVISTPAIGGTVFINPPGPYTPGATVQLQANPAGGYFFYQWSGDLTGSTNPTTTIMDGNKSVTATFLLSAGDDDGDGYSDAREVALGTNPYDPSSHPTSLYVPDAERNALIDLYNSTNGAGWTNKTNWLDPSVGECNWYGVTCIDNHVAQIRLELNNLVGTVPASISNLSFLWYLNLQSNKLTESIPTQVGTLSNLQFLTLAWNQLTGNIPPQLGNLVNLQVLWLHGNQLTGDIPQELGNLANLQLLYLHSNQLTGGVPIAIGKLTNLQYLELSDNKLTGSIPAQLGSLTSLLYLGLDSNQLTGSIPTQLGSLTNLQVLHIGHNQLTGSIPAWLGNLPNLQSLHLGHNQLTGSIPTELGNLANLQTLHLGNNSLTGSVPSELGNLTKLQDLHLLSNQLTGAIPVSLENLTSLVNGGSELGWNALYTTDNTLRAFLNQKQAGGNWENTQTVAPTNLTATVLSSTSVQLTWTPILYTGDTGGYEIWKGTPGPGGTVWSLEYTTPNKSANSYTVIYLIPDTPYAFKLRTVTNPHPNNQNTVYSEYTVPTSIGDDFSGAMIDPTIWADLEVIKRINNGVLESQIRRHGSNGNNYLLFYNPSTVNSFQADVTVKDYQNNSSYPYASLFGRVYRGVYKTIMGDVIGHVGIGHNGTQLEGFWSISRCTTAACNLPNEYDLICSGLVNSNFSPLLNTTYPLSFSWDGSSSFTFGIGGYSRVITSSNCPGLPTKAGLPEVNSRGIGTRVSQISGPNEGGYISATFDNVRVDGSSYDTFESPPIDLGKWWGTLELVSMVDNGELLSELTQRGVNGGYNMSFVNSQAILGFEADLKVLEFQYNPALSVRPHGRLYAALYNDGTSTGPGDITGDVIANAGILDNGQGLGPQAFYAVSHCLAPNCNLSTEYEILTSGIFPVTVGLNQTHRFSLSWDGFNVALGCDGNVIFYNPTSVVSVGGPPRFRKGIGTRVTEINSDTEWAHVSARFDNVVVLSMGYPLAVIKSGTGSGTVTSSPPGINCGSDCGEGYSSGTTVTLTETPSGGSTFSGWSGCDSTNGNQCTVTMNAARSVTATFTLLPTYTVTVSVAGDPAGGSVTPSLSQTVNPGDTATFTVTTNPGYTASVSEGTLVGNTWTIPNVTSTHTATVTFTIIVSPPPTIISITPNYGFVGTVDNFYMINGTGFLPGATVKLTKSGEYDIIAGIDVITSTQIRGRINLSGAAEGLWNVVITNPDSQSYVLTNAFTVNPPGCPTPATPSNPSPSNGATGVLTNQTLSWAISAETDSYDVYFGTSTNPLFVGNVISTSFSLPALNPNTTYYWNIVARNTCGNSTQGPMWNFTTVVAAPLPPILSSPGKGDTGVPLSPILIWNASNGADTYHLQVLQVSTDPIFSTTTVVDEPALTSTSYTVTGPLPVETFFYWQVSASNTTGTSAWSEVWNFKTQPNYVPPFSDLKGISDPPNDNDGDGIDDTWETTNLSSISPQYKTLFVRPKKTQNILGGVYNYWEGFVNLFPDTRAGRYGFADIPAFTNAGIEIVVIGKSCCSDPTNPATCNYYDASKQQCHIYEPFDHFDYDPSKDPNHPNCDILEITYVEKGADFPYCYNCTPNYRGHTFFSTTAKQWSWDTKGYTPSTPSQVYLYKTPEIYAIALDSYFAEGAYPSITVGATSGGIVNCIPPTQCISRSPLNVNGSNPTAGQPDGTVEFNLVAFDNNGQILQITAPLPSTGYDKDTVLKRTIVHEMGHALLNGSDTDHCTDHPECVMNGSTVDWVMHDFGPGTCEHKPGGSKDIRAMIHNNAHYGAAPQAPTLSSPANGASNLTSAPSLSWNAVSGATSYRLQVSRDGFSTYVFDQEITTTSQGLSNLSTGTYSWRVYAIGGNGTSAPSAVWSFTVGPAPPALSSPADGSATQSTTPTLSWGASTGATSYLLEVSTDSGFVNKVYTNSGTTRSRAVPSGKLSNNTKYYWHVNATGANGTSAWSVRSFMTIPGVPTLQSPASGTTQKLPVTLTWSLPTPPGAASYQLQVCTNSSCSSIVPGTHPTWSGITSTSLPVGAADGLSSSGVTYWWRVRAVNAGGGTSAWPSTRNFKTTP